MALKHTKAWLRRRKLSRHDITAGAAFRPVAVGGGGEWDGWHVLPDLLGSRPLVYSFGIGDDISFDRAIIEQYGAEVHGFDPTPEATAWIEAQDLPSNFHFHPLGLGSHDGIISLFPPRKPGRINYSQERLEYVNELHVPVELPVARLETAMRGLGHAHLDVLKIDVEGSEFEAIPEMLLRPCSIRQLLVEIHYHYPTRSFEQGVELIRQVRAAGFECFHVSPRAYEFGFVRR